MIALYKGKVGIDADASVSCTAIYFFSDNTFDATTVISDGKFEADGGHCTFVRQTL